MLKYLVYYYFSKVFKKLLQLFFKIYLFKFRNVIDAKNKLTKILNFSLVVLILKNRYFCLLIVFFSFTLLLYYYQHSSSYLFNLPIKHFVNFVS